VTYTEYMAMSPLQRFWYKLLQFFKAIPSGIGKFFCAIGRGIKKAVCGIGRAIANYFVGFVKGDIITKVSYLIMGFGNVCRGQIIKGLFFFIIEAGYALFMITFGASYFTLFFSLEAEIQETVIDYGFTQVKETTLIHTSVQILLYGLLVIMASIAFLAIYFASVKSARQAESIVKAGGKPKKFRQEMKDMLDSKFHSTMLSLPIILICIFVLLPLLFMIFMAFTNFTGTGETSQNFSWVGGAHFSEIFDMSSSGGGSMGMTFAKITGWTLIWAFFATFSNYILGMVVALMINKKGIKLKKLWRTFFVMSIAVPQFVTLLLMSKMLGEEPNSPLNLIISMFTGETSQVALFSNPMSARITVILVNIWVGIPYTILMTTGILMNIPEDLYESARIDGAGPVKSFMKITLPYMIFVTTPYLITTFIGNVNNFNIIYLLSGGGPGVNEYKYGAGKTDLLITLLFKLSVDKGYYGLGAAIGILVFIVCATLSLITFNMTKSAKNEEEFS